MQTVELYTTNTCGFCHAAKRLLSSKSVTFTEIDVSRDPAKRQAITNPQRTIASIKRFMGTSYDNVSAEAGRMPYEVIKGDNNTPRVKIDDRNYTPQEISAMTLQKMKKNE